MALTRRQRQVLDVIRELIEKNGYSPSLEEIGGQLGLSSVATVHKHVTHLVQKGLVRRAWNQNRSIEIVETGEGPRAVELKLSGSSSVGLPQDAGGTAEGISVPADMVRDAEASFALRVNGESMIDEQIRDGDYVIVERKEFPVDGETVVALIDDGEATLKRYYRAGSSIRLEAARPELPPILVSAERVRVQGVVLGVIRKY